MADAHPLVIGSIPTVIAAIAYAVARLWRTRTEAKKVDAEIDLDQRYATVDEWIKLHQQDVRDMADMRLRFAQMELKLERAQSKLDKYVRLFVSMAAHIKTLEQKLKDMNVPIEPWKFDEVDELVGG